MRQTDDIDEPTWHDIFDRDDEIKKLRKQLNAFQERRMSWDVDQVEFYETFSEIETDPTRGLDGAKEWAWSALNYTQQELRKEQEQRKKIEQAVINMLESLIPGNGVINDAIHMIRTGRYLER